MLHMDAAAQKAITELRAELAWLEAEHPDKKQLAAVARGHLKTIEDAGGFSIGFQDGWKLFYNPKVVD